MSTQPDEGHEREILMAALELPESEHENFIRQACRGNESLKERICKMIRVARLDGSFMAQPIFEVSQTKGEPGIESTDKMIGPFKLLQIIGEGGMGTVYMAEQKVPVERRVALKIIRVGMDTKQVVARFEAERQALAIMDHPNIARVLDAGTTNSRLPYFVMELVRGIPITKYCDEKKLSLRERLELMIPVCHAIQHAHQKGIIHRDIKPSNVLVAQYDGRPVPKVIDFGIAKATAQKLTEKTMFTEFGQVIGTMTAGLIGTTWQTFRATRAESRANLERDKKETALKAALNSAELERQARNAEEAARESESQQRRKAELAEADAREQERIAKEQLAISKAVTEFLQNDILNQAGSHAQSERKYKPGPDITIRKALDRASKSVGERFQDKQELEASIRFTIGNSYLDLGLYSLAIDQLKQSAEIRESIRGSEHLETLSSSILQKEPLPKDAKWSNQKASN